MIGKVVAYADGRHIQVSRRWKKVLKARNVFRSELQGAKK